MGTAGNTSPGRKIAQITESRYKLVNISPAFSKKFVEFFSAMNLGGGSSSASITKYKNRFGRKLKFANDKSLKNSLNISGSGIEINTIKWIICKTSTRPHMLTRLELLEPAAALPAAPPTPTATAD